MTRSLHEKIARAMPRVLGLRCEKCDAEQPIRLAQATVMLRAGWPKCCGYTMRLLTAKEKP